MKILAISEHYFPKVGGTVNYTHKILNKLSELGHEITLLVPGYGPELNNFDKAFYEIIHINAGYASDEDPTRKQRYLFVKKTQEYIVNKINQGDKPDLIHVLFGLYVMEILNLKIFKNLKIPCIATVHNIPPQECRKTFPKTKLYKKFFEEIRLKIVKFKNIYRLKRYSYNCYIVPSIPVKKTLSKIVKGKIAIINHGYNKNFIFKNKKNPITQKLNILTVGGYMPHKQQHLIPYVGKSLKKREIDFSWIIAGPHNRLPEYFNYVKYLCHKFKLSGIMQIYKSLDFVTLNKKYQDADLYVQPSLEEGFCLTALDAAYMGIPIIGGEAGAIPVLAQETGGIHSKASIDSITDSIILLNNKIQTIKKSDIRSKIKHKYSWEKAAKLHENEYRYQYYKINKTKF